VDNIKMDLGEIEWVVWTGLIWLRVGTLVNTVMNLRVPEKAGKFLSICATGGFSRRSQLHEVS
jgi:hypothetical protein